MNYKVGDIVSQTFKPEWGNLIILKKIDTQCYKVKYVNEKLNDGRHAQVYEDAYIYAYTWLKSNNNSKPILPAWF